MSLIIRDYQDADEFLTDAIEKDRYGNKNLNSHDNYRKHCQTVGEQSRIKAVRIAAEYDVDIELASISGLLHDIGKIVVTPESKKKDPDLIFDSIHGYEYLVENGLEDIATTIFPSFTLLEMMRMYPDIFPEYADHKLEPVTMEQMIVVYGDCHVNGSGELVSFDKRMGDIRKRYPSDSIMVRSLDNGGEQRLRALSQEIDSLIA